MEYDIEPDESVSTAVVRAVSAVDGTRPQSMRPLATVLDPDALNNLFDSRGDGRPRPGGRVSFVYGNSRVSVDSGEYLTVRPIDPEPRSEA